MTSPRASAAESISLALSHTQPHTHICTPLPLTQLMRTQICKLTFVTRTLPPLCMCTDSHTKMRLHVHVSATHIHTHCNNCAHF